MKKVWIYLLTNTGDVIHKDWIYDSMATANREQLARKWKAEYGCDRIFAVTESTELRDAWFDYVKTRYSRNGLAAFAKFEFVSFLESEGTELAKAA
ncbi:MAG: hypothetical protein IKD62_02280 [Oscillospiraceae bacterium]|nr:hypothetical protein [Oscillospiraceae bacterium]MBR3585497.1 hypothetical protein [Oscillospiraceae bacterium]